jgi:hypothetical protein
MSDLVLGFEALTLGEAEKAVAPEQAEDAVTPEHLENAADSLSDGMPCVG